MALHFATALFKLEAADVTHTVAVLLASDGCGVSPAEAK